MTDFAAIREHTDLVELVASHLGDGKRVGREVVWLCPFHGERTASFYVNREKGSFYCFGCGAKGDAIDFVQMIDGVALEDALERLGSDAPVSRPRPIRAAVRAKEEPRRDAGTLWGRLADRDAQSEAYLAGRDLLPGCAIPDVLRYNVGASGDRWLDEKARAGYRVAFAVRNPIGRIQTISLRHVGLGEPPEGKKTLALLGCSTTGAAICMPHVLDLASADPEFARDELLILEGGTSWLGAHIETAEGYAEGVERPVWPLGAIGAAQAPGVVTAFAAAIRGRSVLVGMDEDHTGEAYVIPTANAALASGARNVLRVRRDFGARRAA